MASDQHAHTVCSERGCQINAITPTYNSALNDASGHYATISIFPSLAVSFQQRGKCDSLMQPTVTESILLMVPSSPFYCPITSNDRRQKILQSYCNYQWYSLEIIHKNGTATKP
jgi:hypothetical protein